MARIEDLGNSFTAPKDVQHWYKLIPSTLVPSNTEESDVPVAMEIDQTAFGFRTVSVLKTADSARNSL